MKNSIFLIICVAFLACENKEDFSSATVEGLSELPEGAIKELYESNPDLVKVTINQASGAKQQQGDYLNGRKHGNWTEYTSDGLVKSVTSYVDGKKQGSYIELDNRGQLLIAAYYHNDVLHGDWKQYIRTKAKEERVYVNGKLEGTVMIYYDNGKIMEEGSYANGVRDGLSKWYDQEGNVTIEYEYNAGELVNK